MKYRALALLIMIATVGLMTAIIVTGPDHFLARVFGFISVLIAGAVAFNEILRRAER